MGVRPLHLRVGCACDALGTGAASPHDPPRQAGSTSGRKGLSLPDGDLTRREFWGRRPRVLLGVGQCHQTPVLASVFGAVSFSWSRLCTTCCPFSQAGEREGWAPPQTFPCQGEGSCPGLAAHTAALWPFQSRAVATREAGSGSCLEQGGALAVYLGTDTPLPGAKPRCCD